LDSESGESYTLYDPSYGKKYEGVDAVNQWRTDALDGFFQSWEFGTNTLFEVAPNDGNCLIRMILYREKDYGKLITY
jgi:hypothetical protein